MKRWVPALLYMALIFAMSHRPSMVERVPRSWRFRFIDSAGHMAEYGILAVLLIGPVSRSRFGRALETGPAVVLLTSLYGLSDELHQSFVPYRSCELSDFVADSLGAIAAVWIVTRYGSLQRLENRDTHRDPISQRSGPGVCP